ncbi:MAG: hypothetical protein JWM95_1451 [Gemmatimonadetes bacterium]|nr:hypothetical protein [Gemmatimonadota bacterium]
MTTKQKKIGYVNDDYRVWLRVIVNVGGRPLALETKPGVFAHGAVDPASLLLAEHIRAGEGDVVVHLNCGNGLLGSALLTAGQAARVILADRNVLAVEATSRTLDANGFSAGDVYFGHGRDALPPDVMANIVAIRIPQEKLALTQLLHHAFTILEPGGQCYVAGATNEGAKSAAQIMEGMFGNATTIATDSGHRLIRANRTSAPAGMPDPDDDGFAERAVVLRGVPYTFFARPGVFSRDHVDEATQLLVEHMDVRERDRVLDLGCGYGVLGIVAGSTATQHAVTMLDVDSEAVRSAIRSAHAAGLGNARVLASDVAAEVLDEQFDLVVTNPPFHIGKSTDLNVPIQFIHDAWTVLAPGGRLNLVANRTLPYEGAIKYLFRNITKVHDGRRFKVLSAVKDG